MLVMLVAFLIAAFALLCIRVPSVWSALMAIDEPSDPNELGLVVASRARPMSYNIHPPHTDITLSVLRTPPPLSLTFQGTLSVKVDLRHAWQSS